MYYINLNKQYQRPRAHNMAIAARCSLNLTPSLSSTSNPNQSSTQISRRGNEKRRNQGALSLASSCLIIVLQIGDAGAVVGETPVVINDHQLVAYQKPRSAAKPKWSDKRTCPSWRTKTFEIIVPENLPRPSAHRRWEKVGYTEQNAPALKAAIKTDSGCFSM